MSSIDEVGWDPGKETWNGVALAKAAEKDEELPVETTSMPREDGDGASSASSISGKSDGFTKGEDFLHDQTSNPPDVSNWQRDEKLLEELFRLKLNSASPSVASTSVVSGASLPPKQRIKLFQPRTKQEQYEDILIESQLLEASLPEFEVAAFEEAANELDLDLIDGFDYDASDVIFGDTEPTKDNNESIKEKKTEGSSASSSESPLASSVCDCASCRDRRSIEAKETEELERLRKCWLEVREDVWRIYHLVLCDAWKDPNRADEKPDLNLVKEKVKKLVWRDPHQLFTRLESGVREFVLEIKLKLIELLQKQAKNPSLAQDFIQYLLEGYNKLCSAANHVSPALIDLEIEHLRRFSLTWEVLNKHLYQAIIYTDPLIENNLPIFLSQLRSLYPDKEHEARYTELVRGYLDFDVEMVNIASLWKNSEILISEFTQQQNILRAKQRMLKEDWERFKTQRKDLERQMKGKNNDSPTGPSETAICQLGESLNQLLTGLEGMSGLGSSRGISIPTAMERDLRHAMDLESPFLSPAVARRRLLLDDDGNEGDDEVSLEEELSFPFSPEECSQVAHLLSLGLLTQDGAGACGLDFTLSSDGKSENLFHDVDHMFDLEDAEDEINIPWLLAAAAAASGNSMPDQSFASVPAKRAVQPAEPSFASMPAKLTIQHVEEDDDDDDDFIDRVTKEISASAPSKHDETVEKCSCDVCSIPGIAPLPNSSIYPSLTGDSSCPASTANGRTCSADLSKHYPNLYQTILQSNSTNHIKDHQGLAALFPSLLTVDGPKGPTSASVAAELSQALSTALSLSDENFPVVNPPTESEPVVVDNQNQKCQQEKSGTPDKPATPATPPCSAAVSNDKSETNKSNSSSEINKLLQQHYCSHKNKKKHPVPSASAIRKGKVPPPPSCTLGDGDSTDELSEDSSSLAPDDTCSSGSSMTSHANNGKHCSCCYCEVFGHNTGGGGGQAVAPVSRNYPEMRERLRLLLSKKKKEQARCKQPPGSHQIKSSSIVTSSSGSSSASSSTSSVKSMTPSGNVVKKMANQQPPAVAAEKTTPAPSQLVQPAVNKVRNDSQVKPVAKPATVEQPPPVKPIVPAPQKRSLSASSLAPTVPPQQKLEKSQSAVVPKVNGGIPPAKPTEKELESLLEFIEGNASSANEKKKAKKERQKQQRLEELRAREEEERRRREAEEKERKRREEEERQRQEMERQLLKKQKKKAAQRAKKAIAKGVSPEDLEPEPSVIVKEAAKTNQAVPPAKLTMEELRARQMKELMELQARHQRQIEEEKRKLLESQEAANAQANITQSNKANKRGKKNAKNSRSSDKEGSDGPTSSKPTPTLASVVSKAGPGTQIKITRTASGGVEFTTIPADEPAEKKVPVGFGNLPMGQPAPPPYLQNMMFGQGPPSMQPYLPPPPQPSFMPIQPNQDRPSVPSKAVPSQPMVTIRRVENPEFTEPTVTISTQNGKDSNGKKLLYTLINGQIHRAKDAPADLIPTAKPLPPEIGKKLLPTDVAKPTMMSRPPPQTPSHPGSGPAMRPPLPTDSEGKLDLNRLQLPPGISITKIQGPVPERKYFPSKPDPDQNYLPLPGTLGPSRPEISPNIQSSNLLGYSAMAGMPTGMNGPNVIVVEASSLKTREEERKEQEDLKNREEERKSREEDRKDQDAKKKNKKKKAKKDGEQQAVNPQQQRPSSQAGAYPYLMPQIPQIPETNSLKSGPQVLIKNVNGSVVITPIPSNEPSQKVNPKVNAGMNGGAKMPPGSLKPSELECPTLEKPKSSQAHRNCRSSTEENVDDFNSIFVPKDIDLDNGEIDDNDRAVEEFKRFCFDSVPLKQKPKVNFDVKDITFKKK